MAVGSFIALTLAFGNGGASQVDESRERPRDLNVMVDDFATCAVQRDEEAARAVVLADNWYEDRGRLQRLLRSPCGAELRRNDADFIPDIPVAALAGALVRREFAEAGPRSFPLRQANGAVAADTGSSSRTHRARAIYSAYRARNASIGECVVRADPEGARQWILAGSGNGDGVTPAPSFAPTLADCLSSSGESATQPNVVALSYYRLAHQTPRDASGATN